MGSNLSEFKGRGNPVERVYWDDTQAFIRRLNQKEGHTRYRLPTEAEWEYAARVGTTTEYSFGDDDGQLGQYAWYGRNSGGTPEPVGRKKPNPWGLYDMHGNVCEWVQDEYGKYGESLGIADLRVYRGGSWEDENAVFCRSARRGSGTSGVRGSDIGFRLALSSE